MSSTESLDDAITAAGTPVSLLRESPRRPDPGPLTGQEFSNWREEQAAWREKSALFDLSHHMTDLNISGPDALRLLSETGVNTLAGFDVGRAKQFLATNEEGQVIGDGILDHVSEDLYNLAGTPAVVNWVQFHAETGDHDVTWTRDEPTALNPAHHPELFRFQVNGPTAMDILDKVNGGPVPDIRFFHAGTISVGGLRVRALSHNMARARGMELIGPWAQAAQVRDTLLEAGREFGLTPTGSKAPLPATLESGWLPAPLPAVYSGDSMKAYRQWLPADGFEGSGSLGGSLTSAEISDYYLTPADMGLTRLVRFDHDFIGRSALEAAATGPQRRKVTLVWDTDDVMRVVRSDFEPGLPFKSMDLPFIAYATWMYDTVLADGAPVGVSTMAGYTYNERRMLSLAVVDADVAQGSEVTVVWGEPDGGSGKPQVERHRQTEIRAVVAGVPYSDVHLTAEATPTGQVRP